MGATVPETMANDTRGPKPRGQGRGRPEMAGLFIAQIDRLAAGVTEGVVVPGGQAELMGIFTPGVGAAALGDQGAEVGIGQHVAPRRRRWPAGEQLDVVFAPIRRETTESVGMPRILARHPICAVDVRPGCGPEPGRHQHGRAKLRQHPVVELLGQRTPTIGDDSAGNGLEKQPVLGGDVLHRPHEDVPGLPTRTGAAARCDQVDDLLLQALPVAGVILVPDHQVHRQTLHAPVGMRLDELTHQLDVGHIADL